MKIFATVLALLILGYSYSCSSDDSSSPQGEQDPNGERGGRTGGKSGGKQSGTNGGLTDVNCLTKSFGNGVPAWISENFACVQVTVSGSNYVFSTNDIPNHKSAYFGSSDSRYEAVPADKKQNPNFISEQNYSLTVPTSPAVAGTATDAAMDAIGVSVNGVVFYNNEAAPGDSLAAEVESFDGYNGHPTQTGSYHYHVEPTYITNDDTKLIGILLDGFAVFGRKCPATNAYPTDLDGNNGHIAATGISGLDTIYHYHVADLSGANDDGVSIPVITGSYAGTPGTFTNN